MKKARMDIRLWQPNRIPKEERQNWPQWLIIVRSFPGQNGQHEGGHAMSLTRNGELIYWSAHGAEYFEENPDIVQMGSLAAPLETDASAEDVISLTKQKIMEQYHEEPDKYTFNAYFLYEDHFNWGAIPVWIVYVSENSELKWKGVFGYNGIFMDLVPAKQDFYCYQTPNENFFESVFPDTWYEEATKAHYIMEGKLSRAEAQAAIGEWTELYTEWKKTHPYIYEASLMEAFLRTLPQEEISP